MIVPFDGGLPVLRALHRHLADEPVEDAEGHQHEAETDIHRKCGGDEEQKRHRRRQMCPHEFEPQPEEGFAGAQTRMERSEEHTSELQSLMRISYAVLCLKK